MVETSRGFCILHLDSRIPASREEFEKEKDKAMASLLTQKKEEIFNDFLTRLRIKANLEDHVAELMKKQNE